jgi:DUF1680 family protein
VTSSVRRKLCSPALAKVAIRDAFWAPRIEVNRTETVPIEFEQCRKTGRIDAWKLEWREGMQPRPHPFWDSDVAKWIEAAAYSLATHPDAKLERRVDRVIDLIENAQQPDGYLNTYFSVVAPEKRWANLGMWHELYCAGHLIEAAVAHWEATGKSQFLDVVRRYADAIDSVFGPGKRRGCPGHQEIELALVKLYRATGEGRYLELALFFLNQRGQKPSFFREEMERLDPEDARLNRHFFGEGGAFRTEYCQDHLPVREQGQASRARRWGTRSGPCTSTAPWPMSPARPATESCCEPACGCGTTCAIGACMSPGASDRRSTTRASHTTTTCRTSRPMPRPVQPWGWSSGAIGCWSSSATGASPT